MKRVCVTGGAGFIGSHVVDLLAASGYEVTVIDSLVSGKRSFVHPDASLVTADLGSEEAEHAIAEAKPDSLIHLAAQVDVARSLEDPHGDAVQNILGTVRMLNLCRRYGIRKFIYSSSCAVYGDTPDFSIPETHPVQPLSFYGASKLAPEFYIRLYRELYGLEYCILRYANVFGPRQTPKGEGGVVSVFVQSLLSGGIPRIFGSGEQTRDFVYVKDVARANVLAMQKGSGEVVNIGTDTKTSVNELYRLLASLLDADQPPRYAPARPGDILYSRLSREKAERVLGWQPEYSLQEGLRETIRYVRESGANP